jgi:hypothetical protein
MLDSRNGIVISYWKESFDKYFSDINKSVFFDYLDSFMALNMDECDGNFDIKDLPKLIKKILPMLCNHKTLGSLAISWVFENKKDAMYDVFGNCGVDIYDWFDIENVVFYVRAMEIDNKNPKRGLIGWILHEKEKSKNS